MFKKSLLALSMLVFAISTGNGIKAESIEEEKCYVDKNGNVICESDISEGCHFNEDTLEVECEVEPSNGNCDNKPFC